MKTLLTGLLLAVASAQATPVLDPDLVVPPQYMTVFDTVTTPDTPEWAKVPDAKAWSDLLKGVEMGNTEGALLVFDALVLTQPQRAFARTFIPRPLGILPPDSSESVANPEPSTLILMAIGITLLALRKR